MKTMLFGRIHKTFIVGKKVCAYYMIEQCETLPVPEGTLRRLYLDIPVDRHRD